MLTFNNTILLWCIDAASLMDNALGGIKIVESEFRAIVTTNNFDCCIKLVFDKMNKIDQEMTSL